MFGNGSLASVGIDDLLTAVLTLPEITLPQFVGRLLGGLPVHPCHFEELKSVLLRPHLAITLHAHEHVLPSFSFEVWVVLTSGDRTEQHPQSAQGPLGELVSCRQPRISQPLTADRFDHRIQSLKAVPFDVAFVQTEGELVHIAAKVLAAHAVVDAVVAAFQDGPDALNAVCS